MSKLSAILLTLPLTIHASEKANEYHFHSSASYSRLNTELINSNTWQASLNYFWDPISYSNQYPNREAAFVNRLGRVGIQYTNGSDDSDIGDIRVNDIGVSLTYAAKDLNHVFQLDYGWLNVDREIRFFNQYSDTHHIGFAYQYYLLDNLTIGMNFGVDLINDLFKGFRAREAEQDLERYNYGAQTKYLLDLGNENWLTLNAAYHYSDINNGNEDSSHNISASAEYYFNPETSFQITGGANVTKYYRGSTNSESVGLYLHHYFTDQFEMNIGFENIFDEGSDMQQYIIQVNYLL